MPKDWPLANIKVSETLVNLFSDCNLDIFKIEPIILKRPDVLLINICATLKHYGIDIARGRRKFKDSFWRTPYLFKFIKRWVNNNLGNKGYWFTFQIQSIFDCSIDGLPHFVYTDHTHLENLKYESFKKEKLYPPYWLELEKQIYDQASIIFVRSTNIKKSLEEQYDQPNDKVVCVFAGSNVETATPFFPKNRFEKQNLLFVGIDWERKGGPSLVAAFQKIQSRFPKASLTIVGCNPDVNMTNIKIVGRVAPKTLKQYYQDASIFCMPTKEEPFGIAFLEAMQAGLPIIGTNVGAIPDFVQNGWNGYLVEPGDVEQIAKAISFFFDDPEQCRLYGSKSYQLVKEKYNWSAVGEKIQSNIIEYLNSYSHTKPRKNFE